MSICRRLCFSSWMVSRQLCKFGYECKSPETQELQCKQQKSLTIATIGQSQVQKCKVLSRPSKCILICGCKYQSKGHHILSRMCTYLFLCWVRLKLEEVPNWLGNLFLTISPPQAGMMPLLKKSKNCDPELCIIVNSTATC